MHDLIVDESSNKCPKYSPIVRLPSGSLIFAGGAPLGSQSRLYDVPVGLVNVPLKVTLTSQATVDRIRQLGCKYMMSRGS